MSRTAGMVLLLLTCGTDRPALQARAIRQGQRLYKDGNWELGGQMRVTLDRDSTLYHAIYSQRTSCERINNQAQALDIERPKVRNHRSVENLNALIYLMGNVRALQ